MGGTRVLVAVVGGAIIGRYRRNAHARNDGAQATRVNGSEAIVAGFVTSFDDKAAGWIVHHDAETSLG